MGLIPTLCSQFHHSWAICCLPPAFEILDAFGAVLVRSSDGDSSEITASSQGVYFVRMTSMPVLATYK